MGEEQSTQPQAAPAPSMSVWARIKDHKIAQWTLAYAAAAYALLDGTKILGEAFDWPHWLLRAVAALLVLGLPLMVTLAWYHGHRALRRVSGAELTIITVLLVMAGSVLWHFAHSSEGSPSTRGAPTVQTTAASANPGVAVDSVATRMAARADRGTIALFTNFSDADHRESGAERLGRLLQPLGTQRTASCERLESGDAVCILNVRVGPLAAGRG